MQIILIIIITLSFHVYSQDEDSLSNQNTKTFFGLEKNNPTNAMVLSIVPGMGQVYNQDYIKAGIILGGMSFVVGNLIYHDSKFVEFRDFIRTGEFEGQVLQNLQDEREFHRDSRDRMGFFILVVYLVSTVDAFVGSKLNEIDINDDLSVNFYSSFNRVGVNFNFDLSKIKL